MTDHLVSSFYAPRGLYIQAFKKKIRDRFCVLVGRSVALLFKDEKLGAMRLILKPTNGLGFLGNAQAFRCFLLDWLFFATKEFLNKS
ncbi:hypothetical protein BC937DRAFT_93193 [Endogone sp. FLAS-F59071]|nr:hypothetical protein BC937DRAFT_93193 [Endogone sp. FLAS-F59071]|eukprot:RUS14885.1 hypothetical protein BC937DRAFT_93193 [Endogone sp. FLAS-F59071]